jgi:hypothetical protein
MNTLLTLLLDRFYFEVFLKNSQRGSRILETTGRFFSSCKTSGREFPGLDGCQWHRGTQEGQNFHLKVT